MGAFIILDVKFKTEKDRIKFESWLKIKDKDIIVDETSNALGFGAWIMFRNPLLNPIYNLGFMGYEEPKELLKTAKNKKINILECSYIPINDKDSKWKKLRCR